MSDVLPGMTVGSSSARLSPHVLYRYSPTHRWGRGGRTATFIMLNPSTADATVDDPTIRRCIGFARSWGCQGLSVLNLYALRATDPAELWRASDPVGPDNDAYLADHFSSAQTWPLVAAWGSAANPERVAQVLALSGTAELQALGVTKTGQPRHPLYLRADCALSPWPPATNVSIEDQVKSWRRRGKRAAQHAPWNRRISTH
jgi:hypothetical protein